MIQYAPLSLGRFDGSAADLFRAHVVHDVVFSSSLHIGIYRKDAYFGVFHAHISDSSPAGSTNSKIPMK